METESDGHVKDHIGRLAVTMVISGKYFVAYIGERKPSLH